MATTNRTQKLHTIVALVQGRKARWTQFITNLHRSWGKSGQAVTGLSKTYQPRAADGDVMPPENRQVQRVVVDGIAELVKEAIAYYDLVHCQEHSNCHAFADLVVGDETLMTNVPVGFLMFLEKQITDMRTFIIELPTLSLDKEWKWDPNKGCHVAKPEETTRTAKVETAMVLYHATEKHPAQTKTITSDIPVGDWTTTIMSGALPADDKKAMVERVTQLREGIIVAREQANEKEVQQKKAVKAIIDFIFGKQDISAG